MSHKDIPKLIILYNRWCKDVDEILATINPCNPHFEGSQFNCTAGLGCCMGCQHLTPSGCGVKALRCKLWLCPTASHFYPSFSSQIQRYIQLAEDNQMTLLARSSLEEHIEYWSTHNFDPTRPLVWPMNKL